MIDFIVKAYVLKDFAVDAIDFVKGRIGDMGMDIDTERWLHRVGLGHYRPARYAAGGAGLFIVGAVVGCALGLAFARQPGAELRANLKNRARGLIGEAEEKAEELKRTAKAKFDQARV